MYVNVTCFNIWDSASFLLAKKRICDMEINKSATIRSKQLTRLQISDGYPGLPAFLVEVKSQTAYRCL